MPYEIYQTSAENVIAATDATLQKPEGVDETLVAGFPRHDCGIRP